MNNIYNKLFKALSLSTILSSSLFAVSAVKALTYQKLDLACIQKSRTQHTIKYDENSSLDMSRKYFSRAAGDKEASEELTKYASLGNDNIHQAYQAAAKLISAKFLINPISKIARVTEGIREFEKIISLNPNNAEMRYMRYNIQLNMPAIVSYRDHLEEDLKHFKTYYINNKDLEVCPKDQETFMQILEVYFHCYIY
jgi:hypothetical protein